MALSKLAISSVFFLSTSILAAPAPAEHTHGGRSHSHILPDGKIGHQHGQGEKGKKAASNSKPPEKKPNAAIPGKKMKPSLSLQKMHALLRSVMKDPQAVRFGKWWVGEGLPGKNEPQWCGFVNGKNSYGAYTGNKLFISTVDVDKQFDYWMKGPCKPLK